MKRLVVFSFYDSAGIVDDYVLYLLSSFRTIADDICVVVNGNLTDESRRKLTDASGSLFIRENAGFDAWGYKHALEQLGYEKVSGYDEVICLNHTCYGPLYSFDEMFRKMEAVECDWWSLYKLDMDVSSGNFPSDLRSGEHLPSFFIVYRKTLTTTPAFVEWWETMPAIDDYSDAVRLYENRQTPFFDERGFKRAVAYDFPNFADRNDNWPLTCTAEMLTVNRFPLLKRRPYFVIGKHIDYAFYKETIPFIISDTSYDVTLIYDNLCRTQDFSQLNFATAFKRFKWKLLSLLDPRSRKRKSYRAKLRHSLTFSDIERLFNK